MNKNKLIKPLVAVLIIMAIIGIAEILCRIFPELPDSCERHPAIGYRLKPNVQAGEFGVDAATDSLGLVSNSGSQKVAEDAFRILLIGDEMLGTKGISQNETFPRLLEKVIADDLAPTPVEFMIAGAPGWDVRHYAAALDEFGPKRKPDFLIVALSLATDLEAPSDPGSVWMMPRKSMDYFFADLSALYARLIKPRELPVGGMADWRLDPGRTDDVLASASPYLERIDAICRAAHLPWLLALIPAAVQVEADVQTERKKDIEKSGAVFDPAVANRVLERFAKQHAIAMLDLHRHMSAFDKRHKLFTDDYHQLSPAGHKVVAAGIMQYLSRNAVIEQVLLFHESAQD